MSNKQLPQRPNLEQLKKQAKEFHRALQTGDADALRRFRAVHPQSAGKPSSSWAFSLNDAYFVLAREYGYSSWPKLKRRIEMLNDPIAVFLRAAISGDQPTALDVLGENAAEIKTDFICACILGETNIVKAMLIHDPSLAKNSLGPKQVEALYYLCFSRFHRESEAQAQGILTIAQMLLEQGANPNASVQAGSWTPTALYGASSEARNAALTKLLLEAGANPNDNESLYHATENDDHTCLTLLLKFNAAPKGTNALPHSIDRNDVEGVRLLLDHDADPNEVLGDNETALHWAVKRECSIELIDLLLEHGAALEAKSGSGYTAYQYAQRMGNSQAAKHLLQRGAVDALSDADRFIAACMRGDRDLASALLHDNPNSIKNLPASEIRAVSDAGWKCNWKALELMAELGFYLEARGEHGATALHWLCWFGRIDLVERLLPYNPPLEVVCTAFGCTPFGWTAHGADNCQNPGGDYVAVAKALNKAGAQINLGNQWGENLFPEKDHALAEYLRSQGAVR